MKLCLIIILLLLSACSPKNVNLPATSQQDKEPHNFRQDLEKIKEGLRALYGVSSKGEINFNAQKGNAYLKWDQQGVTTFLSRDFVADPSNRLGEDLNKFLTEFRQSVYSNSEGKMYIPGTDVSFQIDDKGITLFIPKTEGVEAFYEHGVAHYNKGQYEEAISDFTKAVEISPKFAGAYCYRGITYAKKGQYEEAISDYNIALEINSKDIQAYNNRGIAYRIKGQYDEAISDCNKALEINPKFAGAYHNRGIAYFDNGQYEEAISDFTKALEINPKNAVVYRWRGDVYYSKGEYDSAISDFNKAIDINPKDVVAYGYRGDAYQKKARYEEAILDYNKAIEIDSKYVLAYNNLAWVLSTAKEPRIRNGKKARELAIKACELSNWKDSAALDTLAAAYAREGDFENAVKWEEKAMESAEPDERADRRERLECYKQRRAWPSD